MRSLTVVRRLFATNPLKMCVVGSGPAGFYAAQHLLKLISNCHVDMYEKLPVPFGLVRFGVAPDHPEVKNVIHTFNKVAENKNFQFFGNVNIGTDLSVLQLQDAYHIIIFAYGASLERKLGIKGEDHFDNIISARQIVSWYNGLPNYKDHFLMPDLSKIKNVTILGHGNVALDIARILATPVDVLRKTDITEDFLQNLSESKVQEINLIGRRGPLNVSFTIKELRELTKLTNLKMIWNSNDFCNINEIVDRLERPRRRLTQLMFSSMKNQNCENAKILLKIGFFKSPEEIFNDKVRFCVNRIDDDRITIVKTDNFCDIYHDLLIKSIGYKSEQIDPNIPFDDKKGIIKNVNGHIESNLFSTGWVSTGPVGVLLATLTNAFETAEYVHQYLQKHPDIGGQTRIGFAAIEPCLKQIVIRWPQWQQIDKFEIDQGMKVAKPREKILTVDKMLEIARTLNYQ